MIKYTQSVKQQVIDFYLRHSKNPFLTKKYFHFTDIILRDWIKQLWAILDTNLNSS